MNSSSSRSDRLFGSSRKTVNRNDLSGHVNINLELQWRKTWCLLPNGFIEVIVPGAKYTFLLPHQLFAPSMTNRNSRVFHKDVQQLQKPWCNNSILESQFTHSNRQSDKALKTKNETEYGSRMITDEDHLAISKKSELDNQLHLILFQSCERVFKLAVNRISSNYLVQGTWAPSLCMDISDIGYLTILQKIWPNLNSDIRKSLRQNLRLEADQKIAKDENDLVAAEASQAKPVVSIAPTDFNQEPKSSDQIQTLKTSSSPISLRTPGFIPRASTKNTTSVRTANEKRQKGIPKCSEKTPGQLQVI